MGHKKNACKMKHRLIVKNFRCFSSSRDKHYGKFLSCLGNAYDAHNPQRLKDYGITHVINATPDLAFCDEKIYRCLRISIHDLPSENISKHFDSVAQYIGKSRLDEKAIDTIDTMPLLDLDEALGEKSHKILVHCSAGISRSPTLVLAYMIKKHHLTLEEALKQMRQARSIVDPNFSFIMQLRSWEKSCLPKADTIDDTRNLNAGAMPYANVLSQPSSRYCGSTTGIKKETKACADAAISVQ